MKTIKPARLHKGDRVGVVAPSQSIYDRTDRFNRAVGVIEDTYEIKLEFAPHTLGEYYYSSGAVQERLDDFHQMIMDPTIKAVFFALGGFTANELIDGIDYDLIRKNPKIITGISDCTTLLNPIYARTDLVTYHGFEFSSYGYPNERQYEIASIIKTFFDGHVGEIKPNPNWSDVKGLYTRYSTWQTIRGGKAKGVLVGGNLTSISHFIGTKYAPDWSNKILILEGYKLDKRRIHTYLVDLRLKGLFDQVSGIVLGYFVGSDSDDNEYNSRPLGDVVREVTEGYDFPIMQIGEIGHYIENAIMPIGIEASMDSDKLTFTIEEETVI